jgi:hypothetical protein
MMSNSRSVSRTVSEVVGSSKMMMRASALSALAISTSWRSPCDRPADRRGRRQIEVDLGQQLGAARPRRAAVDQRQAADQPGEAVDEQVLGDAQILEEVELLVDEGDAARLGVARAARLVGGAVQRHAAAVHAVHAAQDVHRRRLAGAVLADQPQHLAGGQREADLVQHLDAEEALADLLELQQRRAHCRPSRR